MNIFFLEDIRKSFNLINLFYFINKNNAHNDIFIYNDKIENTFFYLNDFQLAFPYVTIISIDEYKDSLNLDTVYLNHTKYDDRSIHFLSSLKSKKVVVLLNNNSGISEIDLSIKKLNPDTYIIWNTNFIYFLLKNRNSILLNDSDKFRTLNYILPNYQFFNHKKIDYLIFMPTKMAFEHEKDLNNFLYDLKNLLQDNRFNNKNIYFKSHQGKKENYLSSNFLFFKVLISVFSILNIENLFKLSILLKNNSLLLRIFNIIIFKKLKHSHNFLELEFSLLPIEFYTNLITDSFIGSFSNTLIISSFFNKKVELLGDKEIKSKYYKRNIKVNSSLFLKLNMSFFLTDNNIYQFDNKPFYKTNELDLPEFNFNKTINKS
jgi:hypothetical protein